ncbi:MAG: LytTR family DNA-binding domain-containing protein [Saprospiraceae bacterium]
MRAIIIDDELNAREALRSLLENFIKGVEVVAEADGIQMGLAAIRQLRPDIVFLDINMPNGTGFDLLEQLETIDFSLVFVTAYDQYAIKAIKFSALDYLLKPVDLQELRKTIERIQQLGEKHSQNKLVEHYQLNQSKRETLALPTIDGFEIVRVADIVRCEGERNYTTFFMKNGTRVVVSRTLKEYEILLSDADFLRVYQSHLINLRFVKRYIRGRGGSVVMEDGQQLAVSREKKEELLEKLKSLG